jgi:hypothetical protein
MNAGRTIFAQLVEHLPHKEFQKCVARYRGDSNPRGFTCWDQYLAMAFAQLTYRESLRDIEACLGVRWLRLFGQVFRVFKWKNCSARRRGGGNVKIGFIDFQGLVGRAENGFFVFRAFHKTGISTACLVAR